MDRVNMLAPIKLPGILQGKLGFVFVDRAPVNQQPGRFVDSQKVFVPVKNG